MLFVYSCDDGAETAEFVAAPAGTRCPPYWLPVWLPIAASAGPRLVCDLRHGPLHGCVMEWDEYRAASVEKRWTSVTAMLTEIADALEYGTDIDGCQPQRSDGTLDWW
ncbi:hypothetical protein IU427_28330 [Nocardia beijingensis]|uniref:hypothetical protein n=1 Tax=Nocardia beijingensis TaxID=95162 RepID=UPI001895FC82|nr:hypothetical protein [Nocardia beijingensis]MBF6469045.1 hypothetical protein [Nocardia beijingensis]